MKIHVDRHKCIGSGQCVNTAPAVFDQDAEDGMVVVLAEEPPAGEQSAARKAAELCPAQVIRIVED